MTDAPPPAEEKREQWIITADEVNPPVWIRPNDKHGLRITYLRLEALVFQTRAEAEKEMSALGLAPGIWRAVKR